jgi:hypothetical protein
MVTDLRKINMFSYHHLLSFPSFLPFFCVCLCVCARTCGEGVADFREKFPQTSTVALKKLFISASMHISETLFPKYAAIKTKYLT